MQFLFSRPYFHVFFKPVITVLSKKVNQTAAAEGNISRVLASLLWVLTAGLQSAAWFTLTLHLCYVRSRPALSGPCRQSCFLSPGAKNKERSGVRFQRTTYQEENSRCALVLRVFQREAEKEFNVCNLLLNNHILKCCSALFQFTFYSGFWIIQTSFLFFLISFFISPRASFISLNAVLCHIEVKTNFKRMFLTITDASICQVFESHVSSLARSYVRKKKLRLQKQGPHIKLTYYELMRWCLQFWLGVRFETGKGEFLFTILFVSVRCRWIKMRQCSPTDLKSAGGHISLCIIWRSREEFCWVQAEWRDV